MNTIHISYFKTDLTEFILGSLEGKLCLADIGTKLTGYIGGLDVKKKLLKLENNLTK